MKEQETPSRIDRMVENAGANLARRTTRRGFLGRVAGAAGATLFGGAVILGEKTSAQAALPSGCGFGQVDVNVCYSPWKAVANYGGYGGLPVFKGPSFSSPMIYSGGSPVVVPLNGHFCRMSNRGPLQTNCPDPGTRANVNGFLWSHVWCNDDSCHQKIGWIPYSVGGVTYAQGDSTWNGKCCGPALVDFDCRRTGTNTEKRTYCANYKGCGGNSLPGTTEETATYWYIQSLGDPSSDSSARFLLRWAPDSTAFFWTVYNDKIKRYGYTNDWAWDCVECWCCAWAPQGCRGWLMWNAKYGVPISQPGTCNPGYPCPQ